MLKNLFIPLLFILSFLGSSAVAQVTPDGILFQAVARDANGNAAAGRNVYAKVTLLKGSATGSTVYQESFKVTSTDDGIFTLVIGKGTRISGVAGLTAISWNDALYFVNIKIAIEPSIPGPGWSADAEYVDMGTSQLWSVPYALFASTASVADSALSISTIVPATKGGTGVNNGTKTISIAQNLAFKGVGDITITSTAASNVSLPTTGLLANTQYVSDRIGTDTVNLSNRINALGVSSGSTSALKVNISDTALMLNPYLRKLDTASLSNRINIKLDSAQIPGIIAPYLASIAGVKYVDTANMLLPYAIRSNTVASINAEKTRALAAEALKINIVDSAAMLLPYAIRSNTVSSINTKINIADSAAMLLPYAIRSNTVASIDAEKTRALAAEALKINIADSALMLSSRFARDTASLSNRINLLSASSGGDLAAETARATTAENLKLNKTDTASMLLPYAIRSNTVASINTKVNIADTAGMLLKYRLSMIDKDNYKVSNDLAVATNLTKEKADSLTLAARITSSETNITTNTNDITSNLSKQKIDSATLRNLINVNTSTINTNLLKEQTDSLTISNKIRTDSSDLYAKSVSDSSVLRGLINTNTNDINTNNTNIANNAMNISVNATNIAANTVAINNRVSFTDMPAFLLPYLKVEDTLNMLSNYRASMIDNNAKIAALITDTASLITRFGFKENLSNKSTDVSADATSNIKYPSAKAVKDFVDNAVTVATPDATTSAKGKIQLSGDLTGIAAAPTVNSVGGSSSSTIHAAELLANAATDININNSIVKRDASGNFNAGIISADINGNASSATKLAATKNIYGNAFDGSADLTQAIAGTYGGTGVNNGNKIITLGGNILTASDFVTVGNFSTTLTSTGETNVTLPTSGTIATLSGTETLTNKTINNVALTGVPTAPTASAGTNTNQVATTAFVLSTTAAATPDATSVIKGKVQLSNDLGGTADSPEVVKIGGSTAAAINTAEQLANTATDANTINKIVKRDGNGDFSAGVITADLLGTATNVTGIVLGANGGTGVNNTGKTITLGGNINTGRSFVTTGVTGTGSDITFKTTNTTNLTLPTSGVVATLAGTEAFTNKTINGLTLTPGVTGFSIAGGTTTKSLTLSNDATVSGTNTGDQTITLTGDVTGTGTSAFVTTLANSGVTAGVYGGATSVPTITVDEKGRITNAAATTITGVSSIGSLLESAKIIVGDQNDQAAKVDMSGDITINNTGATTIGTNKVTTSKIVNSAVTYAKMQNVSATDKILGRVSVGAGIIEEISTTGTGNVVRAISPVFTGVPMVPTAIYPSNDGTIASTQYVTTAINNISASSVSGILGGTNGGTGVDNTGRTITLGGNVNMAKNFITTGTTGFNASDITFKTSGTTVLELPTSGKLATMSDVSSSSIGGQQITGVINPVNGGTGVANDNTKIITLGGSITTGANLTTTGVTGAGDDITFKTKAATSLILPTTGTIATLTGTETLTAKTIDANDNTILNISNANIAAGANIDDSKLATISTTGKVLNAATTASNANTPDAIVTRDSNGAFAAGTITASLNGNANTATKFAASKNIYGNAFDGSANLTNIIASTFGGTGNGFTKFTGPAAAEKVFTLPNADATILTTNAIVTVAQGGTGAATATQNFVFAGPSTGSSAGAPNFRALTASDLPAGSGSYIANSTSQQTSSNFNISGDGIAAGNLSAASFIVPNASGAQFLKGDGTLDGTVYATSGANSNITSLTGLTTALAIGQGGTGSATKNFVDLSTAQTIAGVKTFSSAITFNTDINVNSIKIGKGAGQISSNIAIGSYALETANTTGAYNNVLGQYSLRNNTTGNMNNAFGYNALNLNTISDANSAFGHQALSSTTGANNTGIGARALQNNTSGSNNTSIGYYSLLTNTTGAQNTAIGSGADVGATNLTNSTAIGYGATATLSNTVQLGNASVVNVSTSGTITAGNVTYPKIHNSLANQVLTIDALGVATWAPNSSASLAGGVAGAIPYQSGVGTTSYTAAGTTGQILTSAGTSAPIWTSIIPVANGGTGASTLTSNAVILGNGTSSVQAVAPGTSGNVLVSNGTTWTSQAAPASGVSIVGSISASSNVKGATISGTSITLTPADITNGGIVTAAAQTFAGTKTFADINITGALNGASTTSSTIAGFNASIAPIIANLTISVANAANYNGKVLVCSGSAFTITFDSTVPTGFSCMILQSDNNTISFSGTNNRYNYSQTSGIYAIATALCYTSGSVLLTGDLQ